MTALTVWIILTASQAAISRVAEISTVLLVIPVLIAALIPLAAAAVAVLFLAREPDLPGTEFSPSGSFSGLEVEAPEGQSVAILRTNNPDISVVWIF